MTVVPDLPTLNIAAYRFVPLSAPEVLRDQLKALCLARGLKGTILLSAEGINLFVAGASADVDALIAHLHADARFAGMPLKRSLSRAVPFKRMQVKLKREIIPGANAAASPSPATHPPAPQITPGAPRLSAQQLKQWLDAGRPLTLLDTRNVFEVRFGTFRGARHLHLTNFREFAAKARALDAQTPSGPIVTFCTGGIRCEKAAPMLIAQGLREVYQLDGGILAYFEQCGGAHYVGNCFVFDERVALTPRLEEAGA